jgi:hypothetical protein
VATALLADLVGRGLDPEQGTLFVIDGAKAGPQGDPHRLRRRPGAAVYPAKGAQRPRPPARAERLAVMQRLRRAWALNDHVRALDQLRALADELDHTTPAPPARSPKAWRTRSPSASSASAATSSARCRAPTPASPCSRSSAAPSAPSSAGRRARWRCAGGRRHARGRTAVPEDHRLP